MNIEMKDLLSFVTLAVDAGVQAYIRETEPQKNWVKQSEAKRYISMLGYRPALLRKWVDGNLITPVKTKEAQNAAVLYSLADIKALVSTLKLKEMTLKGGHDYV